MIPFLPALSLLLIAFKLTGVIAISWTMALAPVWIPLAVLLVLSAIIGIATGGVLDKRR